MKLIEQRAEARRPDDLRAVVSHKYKFVYVPVPKCGTTTMNHVLHLIHGIEDTNKRIDTHFSDRHSSDRKPVADVETLYVGAEDVAGFRSGLGDYLWLSVVRNPYDRLVSMYNYDVRRYAKFFDRRSYLYAGLHKRAAALLGRDPQEAQRSAIRSKIGFDEFVQGLARNGTDFDIHFMRQTDILFFNRLPYDRLIDVKRLSADLPSLLKTVRVCDRLVDRLTPLPRANPSRPSDARYDDETRGLAYRLYQPDFAVLAA